MFSKQELSCCICRRKIEIVCGTGFWSKGVCSMECMDEKNWRETLSILNHSYKERERKNGKK